MARAWDSVDKICPFYKEDGYLGRNAIRCEGLSDECGITLSFVSRDAKGRHERAYCNTFDYCRCGIYAAIIKKYEK